MTFFPSFDEVVAAHDRLITLFGGAPGIRDRSILEAALARPRVGYYKDVIEQAAALLESLSQDHPFVDGNKRTEVAVTAVFLRLNGYRLEFDDFAAYQFLMQLYETNQFRLDHLEPRLRQQAPLAPNARPLPLLPAQCDIHCSLPSCITSGMRV